MSVFVPIHPHYCSTLRPCQHDEIYNGCWIGWLVQRWRAAMLLGEKLTRKIWDKMRGWPKQAVCQSSGRNCLKSSTAFRKTSPSQPISMTLRRCYEFLLFFLAKCWLSFNFVYILLQFLKSQYFFEHPDHRIGQCQRRKFSVVPLSDKMSGPSVKTFQRYIQKQGI